MLCVSATKEFKMPFIHSAPKVNQRTPLLPKAFLKYKNIQKSKCQLCTHNERNSSAQLRFSHNLSVPSTFKLMDELERDFPRKSFKFSRPFILSEKGKGINYYLFIVYDHFYKSPFIYFIWLDIRELSTLMYISYCFKIVYFNLNSISYFITP